MQRTLRVSLGVLGIVTMFGARAAMAQVTKGPSGVVHACSLFTDDDIARITGRRAAIKFPADTSALASGHTECHWVNLGAALTPRVTPQQFGATRKQEETAKNTTIESASGVGDEAYFWQRRVGGDQYVGIVFRVGQYQLVLSDMLPPDSVAWLKPKLVELAKFAAPKLK
jgi:hypothetical protein